VTAPDDLATGDDHGQYLWLHAGRSDTGVRLLIENGLVTDVVPGDHDPETMEEDQQ
jgi:hypothetical protein